MTARSNECPEINRFFANTPHLRHAEFRHNGPVCPARSGRRVHFYVTGVDPSDGPVAGVGDGFIGIAKAQIRWKKTVRDEFAIA